MLTNVTKENKVSVYDIAKDLSKDYERCVINFRVWDMQHKEYSLSNTDFLGSADIILDKNDPDIIKIGSTHNLIAKLDFISALDFKAKTVIEIITSSSYEYPYLTIVLDLKN